MENSMLKNGNVGTIIAYIVIVALSGFLIFTLAGFRTDVAQQKIQMDLAEARLRNDMNKLELRMTVIEQAGANREARMQVMESHYADIRQELIDIKILPNKHMEDGKR